MNSFTFTDRMERGQFPVNIPTSLALESLMGIHPERKWPSPPHLKYDEYWMNARTLYRNILSSFPSDLTLVVSADILAELMQDEWEAIKRVLQQDTKLNPTLYLPNYKAVYNRYKRHTVFKGDKTQKQVDDRKKMEKAIAIFLKDVGDDYLLGFDTDIKPENKSRRFIIQTHIALDLLSYKQFEDLDLLESHTGAIKNQSLWYTKYNDGKELSSIPFTQYFLRIFGDKEFFSPMDKDLRKGIFEISQKYGWNSLTTEGRVRLNMEQLKNPYFKAILKDMM